MTYQEARDFIAKKTRENNQMALVWRLSAQNQEISEESTIRFAESLLPGSSILKRLLRAKILNK